MTTPRHHTQPTPGARTLAGKAAAVGKALGKSPYPWQHAANSVALELDDNGRLKYHTVLVSVPRQCGKTTNDMVVSTTRTLIQPGARVWYTAQTGQSARERWIKEVARPVETRLPGLAKIKLGQGDTRLIVTETGSEFRPMPPGAEYLHGEQSDMVTIDEAWVHSEVAGAALLQAIDPTFLTRAGTPLGTQLWYSSTMGTGDSTWWHNKLQDAIDGMDGVCVIDYGIGPDVDPTDVDAVIEAHPLGDDPHIAEHIREKAITMHPSEFARAYGNRPTASAQRIIPLDAWQAAQTLEPIPDSEPVCFGAAIDINRTETAIAAAALVDGIPVVEIVDRRPGTAWAPDRLVDLIERHGAPAPVIDGGGPSGTLFDAMAQAGHEPERFTVRDLTRSCADFLDRLTHRSADGATYQPTIAIRSDDGLDLAADLVQFRKVGDAWAWQRSLVGSIASLEAATLAVHGLIHRPEPAQAPFIITG